MGIAELNFVIPSAVPTLRDGIEESLLFCLSGFALLTKKRFLPAMAGSSANSGSALRKMTFGSCATCISAGNTAFDYLNTTNGRFYYVRKARHQRRKDRFNPERL